MRVGDERRFLVSDLDAFLLSHNGGPLPGVTAPKEALYVRVSGGGDQRSSLAAQETELRALAVGEVVRVYSDVASGLSEKRRGLEQLLTAAGKNRFGVVRVTHQDRLARFGVVWLERLLAAQGVRLEVAHPKPSAGQEELVADFVSVLASFSGRLYGQRSAEARRRLLERATATGSDVGGGPRLSAQKPSVSVGADNG